MPAISFMYNIICFIPSTYARDSSAPPRWNAGLSRQTADLINFTSPPIMSHRLSLPTASSKHSCTIAVYNITCIPLALGKIFALVDPSTPLPTPVIDDNGCDMYNMLKDGTVLSYNTKEGHDWGFQT